MAPRDPEAKRRALLEAALAEFAEHGIAGARVDRLASRAKCSAGLVYTYFGSKDDLFDAVFDTIVERTLTETPITADDLPGYAGRLFDNYVAYPEVARISAWYRLERAGTGRTIQAITDSAKGKVEAIRAAQRDGTVSDRFEPEQLLMMVVSLASMWSAQTVEMIAMARDDEAYRRATVTEAVRRLVS
jgi:AcrR family transcriptional regulator